ncbi:MAG: ABC transporter permease [Vicinamibacterales bacterium]|mgnify:CR=1 FL=1|jgi:predicted permease|nr:hypothetical protein [Acidobacteriota bacterium]MDP6372242.1 ABC transporter permease [Vicinamibacterales bacterium]MDP6609583.1 ABC transporter permease [Vicinamibacterales bacterium]|tara:strand:- start:33663 stop:36119 length:2457 start_codon:yes stop_codon:yes gene_type:complete
MDTLRQNVRYALRRLRQSPGFTVSAVLSLAIGIGANSAIFTLVNAIILRQPPVRAPEELVEIYESSPTFPWSVFSHPDFRDVRDATEDVFASVSATRMVPAQVDIDGGISMFFTEAVTGNYFTLRGIEAEVGRTLLPDDDVAPRAHQVAVLGHGFWQRSFGGDPDIVGQTIRIGGMAYTIVGVVPEQFTGYFQGMVPAIYAPLMMINQLMATNFDELEERGNHSMFVTARLRPGVGLPQAQAALDAVAAQLTEDRIDEWNPNATFTMVPSTDVIILPPFDRFVRAAAWLLMVVVGLVLLMACMNLASFLLARAVDRRKEIAVRLALGATRRDLVGQLVTETVVLGLLGGAAGILISIALLRALTAADLPLPVPVELDLEPDRLVLTFTLVASVAAGLVLGLLPAWQSTTSDLAGTLKDESAGAGRPGRLSLRNALVVLQVTASVLLLVGAGLFLRSFQQIQDVDPGFGRDPAGVVQMIIPGTRYTEETGRLFIDRLRDRLRALPGVEAVGFMDNLHLNTMSTNTIGFNVDGVEPPPDREWHSADRGRVDPGLFDAAGIQIVRGRNFDRARDTLDSQAVAIVSAALAERFWGRLDVTGELLRREDDPDLMIVGVASDAKVRTMGEAPRPFVYLPYSQSYSSFLTVVARTSIDAERTALDVVMAGREIDPEIGVWDAKSMAGHLGIMLLPAQLSALVLAAFAVLALALACVGLHGIVSYAVAQRVREVGIRLSLGAEQGEMVRMLMASGMKLVLLGSAVGLVLALAANRVLSGLLFGIGTFDPLTFVAMPTVLIASAVLATWIAARRAASIDPAVALRAE